MSGPCAGRPGRALVPALCHPRGRLDGGKASRNPTVLYTYEGCFHKIRGPLLGVLVIRIIVYWGVFWGPLFMETPVRVPPSTVVRAIQSPGLLVPQESR